MLQTPDHVILAALAAADLATGLLVPPIVVTTNVDPQLMMG